MAYAGAMPWKWNTAYAGATGVGILANYSAVYEETETESLIFILLYFLCFQKHLLDFFYI